MPPDPYAGFPTGFFRRTDESPDPRFYGQARLVTHIDDDAIAAVGALYDELGVGPRVLDLMSSWVSHFTEPPAELVVLGMNGDELDANDAATERIVHDLNADATLPLPDDSVDDVVCCVSVDYLATPIEVFREVARVLRPGGRFVCTFSNRVFPTKAIHGWLALGEADRPQLVESYFDRSGAFGEVTIDRRTPTSHPGDPLWAVWAAVDGPVPPAGFDANGAG